MTWKMSCRKSKGIRSWERSLIEFTNTLLGLRQRRGSSKRSGWRVKDLKQQRIASGIFQWKIESKKNPYGLDPGTYPAASDGLWVYLQNGLQEGHHTVKFGGRYEITPFGTFEGTKVTYNLRARQ